jgi:hypothetical protein
MTEYLTKAQDKALKHKVIAQPWHQSDDNEIMWSYEVEFKWKMRIGPSREKTHQVAKLGNKYADVHTGSRSYYTSPAHM